MKYLPDSHILIWSLDSEVRNSYNIKIIGRRGL